MRTLKCADFVHGKLPPCVRGGPVAAHLGRSRRSLSLLADGGRTVLTVKGPCSTPFDGDIALMDQPGICMW